MKFDLHVHSHLSYDCNMTTDELAEAAKKAGLTGVAVCDHNVFFNHRNRNGIYMIPACEYSTDVGHLVMLFQKEHINESLARDKYGRYFWRDVVKSAHDQGALIFFAHPFSPEHKHSELLYREIDGVEVFNSRVVHSRIRNANGRALNLCRELKKPFSAGSDAHSPSEVGTSYWECSLPESELSSPDFEDKLKAELIAGNGRVFAGCASPFTVLKNKRRMYRSEKLYGRLFKSYLILIYKALARPFERPAPSGYIDVKGE